MPIAKVAASASGDNAVVAAQSGKKISVRRYLLSNGVATAQTVKWRSAANDLTGLLYAPAAVGRFADDGMESRYLFQCNAGEALNLNLSAATAVGGYVVYDLES